MTTGVDVRKRETIFSKLDSNNDGVIDETDITAHITKFLTKFDVPPTASTAKELLKSGGQILKELGHVDPHGKQVITKREFVESIDDRLVEKTYISMNGVFFKLIDTDGDGQVTEAELVAALKGNGLAADDVRRAFQALDANGDGGISKAEWDQATRQMLLSSDPQAPGSLLLGIH